MWRYVLSGLVIAGGLVALFAGSFGGPDRPSMPSLIQAPEAPAATRYASAQAAEPAEAAPRADDAALQGQRDALLQKLQDLQTKVAQAVQDTVALRRQADEVWNELEALRPQRAADAAAGRTTAAPLAAEPATNRPNQPNQDAVPPKEANATLPTIQQKQVVEPPQEVKGPQPATQQKQDVEPPQEVKVAPQPRLAAAVPSPPPRPPQPVGQPTVKPAKVEPDAREAVLARLRHQPRARGEAEQIAATEPRAAPPRQRLLDARAALAAGRLDEAEQLLQQVQLQLVLRPVGPSQDASVTGSVAAGQVAEALSMLGAGDVAHAMQYVNLAVVQADQSPVASAGTGPAVPRQ